MRVTDDELSTADECRLAASIVAVCLQRGVSYETAGEVARCLVRNPLVLLPARC
jgi:hypothetical protein